MEDKKNPLSELMRTTMEHIKTMADANTIIGTPIHAEGVTLIPVSKMSFGVGGGGTEYTTKQNPAQNFGGGSAASAKLEPVAFLVIREDGSVKLLPVAPPPATTVDRVIETVPEVVDKVTGFIEKQQEKKLEKQEKEAGEADFAE